MQSRSPRQTESEQRTAAPFDPLRFCIFTTVALMAWALGPPVVVAVMSGLGLWAYGRAWQQGLRTTKCFLRDPRLVIAYLGATFALGCFFTVRDVMDMVL